MAYRILFTDMSPMVVEVMHFAMDSEEYIVDTSQTFQKTYSLINEYKYDLLILDFDLNAFELVNDARKSKYNKEVEILITSFLNESEIRKTAKKLGVSGWIEKPFIPERLVKKIKEFLAENEKHKKI